jgi:hypothetical protein
VNAAITDVRTAMADTSSANFQAVVNDVNNAITEWNAAYAQAGSLALTLNVNNAQLQFGMTPSQVQSALASGTQMNVIQYYNRSVSRIKAA